MIETCPYCRETIEGEDAIRCLSCGTPHHKACFTENGGCTVFGCESAPSDVPKTVITSLDIPTSAPPPALPVELQSARTLYFVNRGGQQYGPYSLRELQQYVGERRVAITDLAWAEGMPQWVFVQDVIGDLRQTSHNPAPRGYELRRRADTARQVIGWSFAGLIVLGIIIAILSSITR